MPDVTRAGQAEIRYIKETTEGDGIPTSGTLRFPSDSVRRVRWRVASTRRELRDIGDALKVVARANGIKDLELEVEFDWQDDANILTALQDWTTRSGAGKVPTYALEYAEAVDAASGSRSYYTIKGAKASRAVLKVDPQELTFFWAVTFRILDVDTADAQPSLPGTTTRQTTAIGTSFFAFTGGEVVDGAAAALAVATSVAGVTVDQALGEGIPNVGSTTYKTFPEGYRTQVFDGTLTVDDGGKALVDAAIAGTEVDIVIKASKTAGKPKITLSGCDLEGIEWESNTTDTHRSADVTRRAKSLTWGTV